MNDPLTCHQNQIHDQRGTLRRNVHQAARFVPPPPVRDAEVPLQCVGHVPAGAAVADDADSLVVVQDNDAAADAVGVGGAPDAAAVELPADAVGVVVCFRVAKELAQN